MPARPAEPLSRARRPAETIELTAIAIEKHLQVGFTIALIDSRFPDLPASLTYDDVRTYLPSPYREDPQGMAVAHQRTMDRLEAAGYVPQDDEFVFPKRGGRDRPKANDLAR